MKRSGFTKMRLPSLFSSFPVVLIAPKKKKKKKKIKELGTQKF